MQQLYTIGHSNHEVDVFLSMIQKYNINCIVDVRSVPVSAHTPQFNKDTFSIFLRRNEIYYLHFGLEFGARRYDCVDDKGQVNFEIAIKTEAFQQGVSRTMDGLNKNMTISLMCSEADPLSCHRFALVARYFYEHNIHVLHILKDSSTKTHEVLQQEMIDFYVKKKKISEVDRMFNTYSEQDQIIDAYKRKNEEIGFKLELTEQEIW